MGLGYGLVYFLPVECAWSYFPEKQSFVSGIILCCYSLGAVSFATASAKIVNPDNEAASVPIVTGATTEMVYPVDSVQVANLPTMFRDFSVFAMCMFVAAILLIRRNPNQAEVREKRKHRKHAHVINSDKLEPLINSGHESDENELEFMRQILSREEAARQRRNFTSGSS